MCANHGCINIIIPILVILIANENCKHYYLLSI